MITEVTWYKAVVNSLVSCDLCDHSQISHVVSNDVRSDILLTTLHVITDWPISDHMIGTSHRGPVRRSMFHCVLAQDTAGTGSQCCALPGGVQKQGAGRPFINGHPTLHCHCLYRTAGLEVVKSNFFL
ncbi:unnamed protein product, partial [Staurois parvus]